MVTSISLLSLMASRDVWSYFLPSRRPLWRLLQSSLIILVDSLRPKSSGPVFHNALITEITLLCGMKHSSATAYSSEENGIVERANQEVLRHLRALLYDSRVHDKWSFEQLPLVQLIMSHSSGTILFACHPI